MGTRQSRSSVVVGIDGSHAAIDAARWAVDEATDRDVPLRLVYVIDEKSSDMSIKLQYAESALRAATRAVQATAKPVGIETSIVYGSVWEGLAEESKAAVMICVGSTGIGRVAWRLLGSTATTLADTAHCPVAIIRRHTATRWLRRTPIAVAVAGCGDGDPAIELAMQEANLRHAPVLAVGVGTAEPAGMTYNELDRGMEQWRNRCPGVPVQVVVARDGFAHFLSHAGGPVALAVIPTDETMAGGTTAGPAAEGLVRHARCSVLVAPTTVDHQIPTRMSSTSSGVG